VYRVGKDLPDLAQILGGLGVKKPREDWPSFDDDDDAGSMDYLWEAKEHQELLYHFLRTAVLLHDQYNGVRASSCCQTTPTSALKPTYTWICLLHFIGTKLQPRLHTPPASSQH
jgi:hypothetical protein